jgi:hypothetical protein
MSDRHLARPAAELNDHLAFAMPIEGGAVNETMVLLLRGGRADDGKGT